MHILRPFISLSTNVVVTHLPRLSTIRMKRKGERGSPYHIPCKEKEVKEGEPLTKIEKKVVEVKGIIRFVDFLQNLKV